MNMKKCPKCGELYSESYTTCPFCVDDDELRTISRASAAPRWIVAVVVVLLLVLAGAAFVFFGDALRSALPQRASAPTSPLTDEIPMPEPEKDPEVIRGGEETLEEYELTAGEELQMRLVSGNKCTWSVSDPTVASISEKGLLTAVKAGKTRVVATLESGEEISVPVTVNEAEPEEQTEETTPEENSNGGTSGSSSSGSSSGSSNSGSSNSGSSNSGSSNSGSSSSGSSSSGSSNSGSSSSGSSSSGSSSSGSSGNTISYNGGGSSTGDTANETPDTEIDYNGNTGTAQVNDDGSFTISGGFTYEPGGDSGTSFVIG